MKGFKQLVLAAAVLAAPFMAQADLKAMDDSALSTVTGQDGISISGNFGGSVGNVKYTDNDIGGGSLNITNVGFNGFTISDATPLTVDVVTNAGGTQQLAIGLPAMTGTVTVGGIYVGGTYAAGATTGAASIGSLAISDINMAGTTIKVWGH
ncbi:DUF6160 family protein [Pseudomonas sp. 2FE]|uniref:DUF6160 family protein n=1 Tax=Pseudomonas sp. 2FE TaxID=2502190 RepID=UPI0010F85047|nr:DUF6160 family protein [Pseudomonas sp. 2FE]